METTLQVAGNRYGGEPNELLDSIRYRHPNTPWNGEVSMTPFPREDYRPLRPHDPGRTQIAVNLSDNTNLWGPPPAAQEVVRLAPPEALTRYPSAYASDLKEAIAAKYAVSVKNITTGCGSDGILDAIFRASTFPPGRMRFPVPTFSMVKVFAQMNGLERFPVSWVKAEVDPARLLLDEPDLVYICRPNNPTGSSLAKDWLHALLALGGPQGPLVVLDEAYADFGEDSFLADAPSSNRLLVLRTFSKLYGLAGLRVGFAVGPTDLIEETEKSRGPYKVSQVAERAAVAALEDSSGWCEKVRVQTVENRTRLEGELKSRGLHPLPSQGNFLLIPVNPAGALEVNRALAIHGVACRPFPDIPEIGEALRVTVGPWPLMERFLEALDALFEPAPKVHEES
jgi:histidinol-phosphate aminotransferase